MLFEDDNFPGKAGEDTQEARVFEGIFSELLFEGNRREITE